MEMNDQRLCFKWNCFYDCLFIALFLQAVVEKSRTSLQNRLEELQRIRVEQVRGLTTFIFPLTGIQQNEGMDRYMLLEC